MKPFSHYMRIIHRDLGFFLIGLTIVYCFSGILLIYRESDFLKVEKTVVRNIKPGLSERDLAMEIRMRDFKPISKEDGIILFNRGSYNSNTGELTYTSKELPKWINKLIELHKSSSRNPLHWINLFYGVSLFFMAISSLWMFRIGSKNFKRGLYFMILGGIIIIGFLSI